MPYRNKQMLRDANGDLIPQYWDVVEQEFKPLTGRDGANDVRLTGSIMEEFIYERFRNIPAGESVIIGNGINVSRYRYIKYAIWSDTHHDEIQLRVRPRVSKFVLDGFTTVIEVVETLNSTEVLDNLGTTIDVRLENGSDIEIGDLHLAIIGYRT